MKKLENKTVFITGGLSSIGRACAIAAAKEGANIVIAEIKSFNKDKLMEGIKKENPKAIFIECDVTKYNQVQAAIEKTVNLFGTLDIVFNNVGIIDNTDKASEMTEKKWSEVINIDLNRVLNCMKHELVQMTKQKSGVIVNISSIMDKDNFVSSPYYVAAKRSVSRFIQTEALEYATQGIRINGICPGFIRAPLLTDIFIDGLAKAKELIDLYPIKRLATAAEIAEGFIFLAGNESYFISGTTLEIDDSYLEE